ncbi:MAG TPA: mannosyltransferase family protein [Caulobacteraceae bacterium]|nr:mannosyltransferase family protein [Caulobacteraceae bacterium]
MAQPSAAADPWRTFRTVFLVWLGWAVLMLGFQDWVQTRFQLQRPDTVKDWTASWTNASSDARHPYLQSQALKGHAAWDSEFYISIALHGYEDPAMRAASPASTPDAEVAGPKKGHPTWVSLNHAFFPGYPFAMGLIARPLAATGFDPVSAATIAGVVVSLVSALFAMLAIADLAQGMEGAEGGDGVRAGFYLAVWPAAAFLAQVYSEALFLALSFGALAVLRRGAWGWAAALAVGAVFTRATGLLLVIPFGLAWLGASERRTIGRAALAASPVIAYLVWRLVFGADFDFVETRYFGRWPFALGASLDAWSDFAQTLLGGDDPQGRAYDLLELFGIVASLVTSALLWRRDKALTLYGLATFVVVATSGAALGMHRYALAMPSLFLAPARLGRGMVFDRVWTLACCLGLAVLTLLFSFGFWAG